MYDKHIKGHTLMSFIEKPKYETLRLLHIFLFSVCVLFINYDKEKESMFSAFY